MDKLPAISGLAREFQIMTGFRYVAGLWESQLLLELLWYIHDFSNHELSGLSSPYRSPSWSWAVHDNPVDYIFVTQQHEAYHELNLWILDIELATVSDDPLGQLKSVVLKVRSFCAGMQVGPNSDEMKFGPKVEKTVHPTSNS
jgi:hypothetical protein